MSIWWRSVRVFDADLATGHMTLNDRGPVIFLSGTQVAVLAVACVFALHGADGLDRHPALDELRGYVPVKAR